MKPTTGRSVIIAVSLALPFMGCADKTGACIEEYSAAAGYGHEGDQFATECIDPCHSTVECGPPTVVEIQDECFGDGHPCAEPFITRDAAVCVADTEGLDHGLDGPFADLRYDDNHFRPVWDVRSLVTDEEDEQGGDMILIDAVTGEVLLVGGWEVSESGGWEG